MTDRTYIHLTDEQLEAQRIEHCKVPYSITCLNVLDEIDHLIAAGNRLDKIGIIFNILQ